MITSSLKFFHNASLTNYVPWLTYVTGGQAGLCVPEMFLLTFPGIRILQFVPYFKNIMGIATKGFCSQMSMSSIPTERIDQRLHELESLLKPLDELLNAGGEIRLEEGILVVPVLPAEDIPLSAKALREQINQRLPKVNITDMIKEVDEWIKFSEHLQGLENEPRNQEHQSLLYPHQNNLMYVLQACGQLIKTNFILKYLLGLPLRRKINTQLIKGEQLHYLRLYLWFGSNRIVRRKQEEQQHKVVRSLNLMTNIILVWNTVYQQEIIRQLHLEGYVIDENDRPATRFAFISLALF